MHGHYHTDLADIAKHTPPWSRGCAQCRYGIVSAPELTGAVPLYLERLVQVINDEIVFCSCRAGQSYRKALETRYRVAVVQARQDSEILVHRTAGSQEPLTPLNTLHVDGALAIAQHAIAAARVEYAPTVHYDAADA